MRKLIFMCLFLSVSIAQGKSLKGVNFDDSTKVGAEELTLNGLGLRLATIFDVKVYVGALYVKNKSNDANKIITDTSAKKIVMHFVRSVDREDLIKGFQEGLANNEINYEANKEQWDKFFLPIKDVEDGDRITINVTANSLELECKGQTSKLEKFAPAQQFVKLWLGSAPNSELKEGMLGILH